MSDANRLNDQVYALKERMAVLEAGLGAIKDNLVNATTVQTASLASLRVEMEKIALIVSVISKEEDAKKKAMGWIWHGIVFLIGTTGITGAIVGLLKLLMDFAGKSGGH